ncbi:MAG: glutamate-5-semialdehyde dehydrogenase [Candidatus Handelsmanbacteria bacterium]|nr:glutamate-5-semialdehyde dehydrogenase [Candidatus Handelsmanbacteria bacterium]
MDLRDHARQARRAARQLALTSAARRNAGLEAIALALEARREEIQGANRQDLEAAKGMVARGELAQPLVKRLDLGGSKFGAVVEMVQSVRAQADPLGRTLAATELAQGLRLFRVSVPIGVLGVIFESRPDALVQIASLCLKAGDAVLLKGGREAERTNQVLYEVIKRATEEAGLPQGWIWLLETREEVRELLALDEYLDLIIPRGSNEFVRYIMENTRIPVTGHADGVCHVYVDRAADLDKALRVTVDAKTQYAAVCNAAETLLVHRQIAPQFLARAVPALKEKKVELRGDAAAAALVPGAFVMATEADWGAEYLDYVLAVKVVDSLEEAVEHINRYGSHHTDTILTEDAQAAGLFLGAVDSASVIHNASTRFADGFRYGLGAEVGISTGRLHSRGPVGLEGLTSYKYILEGDGHTVDDFEGAVKRPFTHRPLKQDWRPAE